VLGVCPCALSLPKASVSFKYDPCGRRIQKSSTSGTTIFSYDGDNLIEEVSSGCAAVARYTEGLGIDEPLAMHRSGVASYCDADGLGSITSLTTTARAVTATYSYDSFGVSTGTTGSETNPYRYTGREIDARTALHYYRARYYAPKRGKIRQRGRRQDRNRCFLVRVCWQQSRRLC